MPWTFSFSNSTQLLHQMSLLKTEAHREEMEVRGEERPCCEDILRGPGGVSVFRPALDSLEAKGEPRLPTPSLAMGAGLSPVSYIIYILFSFFM